MSDYIPLDDDNAPIPSGYVLWRADAHGRPWAKSIAAINASAQYDEEFELEEEAELEAEADENELPLSEPVAVESRFVRNIRGWLGI